MSAFYEIFFDVFLPARVLFYKRCVLLYTGGKGLTYNVLVPVGEHDALVTAIDSSDVPESSCEYVGIAELRCCTRNPNRS